MLLGASSSSFIKGMIKPKPFSAFHSRTFPSTFFSLSGSGAFSFSGGFGAGAISTGGASTDGNPSSALALPSPNCTNSVD